MTNGFDDVPAVGKQLENLPAEEFNDFHNPGAVRLYGRPAEDVVEPITEADDLDNEVSFELTIVSGRRGRNQRRPAIRMRTNPSAFRGTRSLGVIYGYSYEGHCYRLPKPKVMFLPVEPNAIRAGDCGFDPELGYAVWVLDKKRRCVALDIQSDEIETIILDENLPGRRSPLTYAQNMLLAPQRMRD